MNRHLQPEKTICEQCGRNTRLITEEQEHQILGKQVRVFGRDDHMMFEMFCCELTSIEPTYITVLIDDGESNGGYTCVVPLAEITQIDTLPEVVEGDQCE